MSPDCGLEATRAIREKLSRKQFTDRLRWASASTKGAIEEAEPAAADRRH
jgi:hypothetical protein